MWKPEKTDKIMPPSILIPCLRVFWELLAGKPELRLLLGVSTYFAAYFRLMIYAW